MIDSEKQARIFKVLSVGTRVRMIELLKHRSLCVNALARALEITPAAVSQHLRILRDADIVTPEKRGYFVHYRINEETLAEWNQAAQNLLVMKEPKTGSLFLKRG
ncbi:MAG: metalloregulator ArsR/SmtB family transcription factor [Thermodesulfobacteriota bacterium]